MTTQRARRPAVFEGLGHDLRLALRGLRNGPGFALVTIATLALGVGATSAVFSVIDAVLLAPLPFESPERLVTIWESSPTRLRMAVAEPNFLDIRESCRSFEAMAALSGGQATVHGGREPSQAQYLAVSRGFFRVLNARPLLGRVLADADETTTSRPVAVVSKRFWERSLGLPSRLEGLTISLLNRGFDVVGVLPAGVEVVGFIPSGYTTPEPADIYVSKEIFPDQGSSRSAHNLRVVGRLAAGATPVTARAELDSLLRDLRTRFPNDLEATSFSVIALHELLSGTSRPTLLMLLVAVAVVLAIACVNVTHLLLTRAATRGREMAIRSAIGATSGRLFRKLATESLVLGALGGALGLILAAGIVKALAVFGPADFPRLNLVSVGGRVVAATFGVSLLAALCAGLVPAWCASRSALRETLSSGGRGATFGGPRRAGLQGRDLLAVTEVALALTLLMGAGLLVRSLIAVLEAPSGLSPANVVTLSLSLDGVPGRDEPAEIAAFTSELLSQVDGLPDVVSAGSINSLPLTGKSLSGTFEIQGRPPLSPNASGSAGYRIVGGDYFRALGIPLVKGRLLSKMDIATAPNVALINRTLARRYFADQDPIGQALKFDGMDGTRGIFMEIAGVVGDVRHAGLHREASPEVYLPLAQRPERSAELTVVARTRPGAQAVAPSLRRLARGIDPRLPATIRTMDEVVAASVAQRRFSVALLMSFAGVAIILALVGIFGVISYSVAQRTKEFGVRVAVGATRTDILAMVLSRAALLGCTGGLLGLVLAFGLTRLMTSLLFGVSATDPALFTTIPVALVGMTLLAGLVPASRAAAVDPLVALRCE